MLLQMDVNQVVQSTQVEECLASEQTYSIGQCLYVMWHHILWRKQYYSVLYTHYLEGMTLILVIMVSSRSSFFSSSSTQNFMHGVKYAFSKLGVSHLKLKSKQIQAIVVAYEGKTSLFFLLSGFGKSICKFSLFCTIIN